MHKQVIYIMESDQFPFGQFSSPSQTSNRLVTRTLVKKIHQTRSLQERNLLLDKISAIKNLKLPQMIGIQTVLQDDNSIHVLYQYVHHKGANQIKNISSNIGQKVQKLKQKILQLGVKMAQGRILMKKWSINNLGMDEQGRFKYYLDLSKIEIERGNQGINEKRQREICKVHNEQINNMFSSYLKNEKKQVLEKSYNKNCFLPQHKKTQSQHTQTHSQAQLKRSRQNWKQIEHDEEIMKDFINVLDDEEPQQQEENEQQEQEEEDEEEEEIYEEEIIYDGEDVRDNQSEEQHRDEEEDYSEEEIIWEDETHQEETIWDRQKDELQLRVESAIERSKKVIQVFKKITRL